MSELFLEIQEELKREKIEKLWRKVGRFAVWGSVGAVALTACFVAWENHVQGQAEEKTALFLQADERIKAQDYKEAVTILAGLASDDGKSYYPLAMLKKAQAQELAGDKAGAEKTYSQLAARSGALPDLAKLAVAGGQATNAVFAASAAEKDAWELLAQGKKEDAVSKFAALVDGAGTPSVIVLRAKEVLRVIAPEKLSANLSEKLSAGGKEENE